MLSVVRVKSDDHLSCEDAVYVHETNEYVSGGVFDGCSTGQNSYFASQLWSYAFEQWINPTMDYCIGYAAFSVRQIAEDLKLEPKHLWSTCLLFYYDKLTRELTVRCFGDGFFYINDVEFAIELENKVDYLADNMQTPETIANYLIKHPPATFQDVSSFRICSDGIKAILKSSFHETIIDPYVLLHRSPSSKNYLERMCNIIRREKFSFLDDLTIVSYTHDTNQ